MSYFENKKDYQQRIDDYNCILYDLALSQIQGVKLLQKTLNNTLEKLTPCQYPKYIKYIDQLQKNIESMQKTANDNFSISCAIDSIAKKIIDDIPEVEVENND